MAVASVPTGAQAAEGADIIVSAPASENQTRGIARRPVRNSLHQQLKRTAAEFQTLSSLQQMN